MITTGPDKRYDGLRLTMHLVVCAAVAALPSVAEVVGDATAVGLASWSTTLGVSLLSAGVALAHLSAGHRRGRVSRTRTPYEEALVYISQRLKSLPSAVLLPTLGFLLFAIQCLSVARFHPGQARYLFFSSSLPDAVRAFAFIFAPLVFGSASLAAALVAGYRLRFGPRRLETLAWIGGALVLGIFMVLLAQGSDLAIGRDLGLLALIAGFVGLGAALGQVSRLAAAILLLMVPIELLFVPGDPSLFSGDVWLPLERFYLDDGTEIDGYFVRRSEDHLLLLFENDRVLYLVDRDAVEARVLCDEVSCHKPIRPRQLGD